MFHFRPIGIIRSCFREKFGIPRQPGLVPRPAYEQNDPAPRRYGMKLYDCDVRWERREGVAYVTEIVKTDSRDIAKWEGYNSE